MSFAWEFVRSFGADHRFPLTLLQFSHGLKRFGHPFSKTKIFIALTSVGLWPLPRHTSPMITQPKSRFWAYGALGGPLNCLLTLCTLRMSLPSNRRMSASGSKGLIGYGFQMTMLIGGLRKGNLYSVFWNSIALY